VKRRDVFALGQDREWLRALDSVQDDDLRVQAVFCLDNYLICLDRLPPAGSGALLLMDSYGQPDLIDAVRKARKLGWPYVIVVTAAANWREAYRAMHDGGASDCWIKNYASTSLRREIENALTFMASESQ